MLAKRVASQGSSMYCLSGYVGLLRRAGQSGRRCGGKPRKFTSAILVGKSHSAVRATRSRSSGAGVKCFGSVACTTTSAGKACRGRLAEKVAIVTGAGSSGPGWGIGKAIAVLMSREGAKVGLVDLNTDAAKETRDIIQSEGGECMVLPTCDVSKPDQVEAMVAVCELHFGHVSVLVNNVGVTGSGDVTTVPLDRWEFVNAVNLDGVFNCTKTCIANSLSKDAGLSVINISSVSGIRSLRSEVAYCCSKAAVNSFTVNVAREFAGRHIRCNAILPGLIDTPLVHNAFAGQDMTKVMAERNAASPTGQMGDPWDVAQAALYLSSDESRYTNGVIMPVDGGLSTQIFSNCHASLPRPSPPLESSVSGPQFTGCVALIRCTGGLREVLAATFAKEGAEVVVEELDDELGSEPPEAAVKRCIAQHGRLDFLINGPGSDVPKSLVDTSYAEFRRAYSSAAGTTFLAMRSAVPFMCRQGAGAIVNILSPSHARFVQPEAAIAAASGSVRAMTFQTAVDFAKSGVRCNAIVPLVLSSGSLSSQERLGNFVDIANAATHLCSHDSRYTSGNIYDIDLAVSWRPNHV